MKTAEERQAILDSMPTAEERDRQYAEMAKARAANPESDSDYEAWATPEAAKQAAAEKREAEAAKQAARRESARVVRDRMAAYRKQARETGKRIKIGSKMTERGYKTSWACPDGHIRDSYDNSFYDGADGG